MFARGVPSLLPFGGLHARAPGLLKLRERTWERGAVQDTGEVAEETQLEVA